MLRLDGSLLEGGGQILRLSAALSAILNKPITIDKIRAGRSKPGLKAQHLTGLNLVNQLCNGTLSGCQLHSEQLTFSPKDGVTSGAGPLLADIGTAGGITLLVQVSGQFYYFLRSDKKDTVN